MSYGDVHSSRACSISTCDSATLSGGRWETLKFMSTSVLCTLICGLCILSMLGMLGGVYALTLWQMSTCYYTAIPGTCD